jgi:hypothetical protein
MTERLRLPNRRGAETFDLECAGLRYRATIGRFADDTVAEVFLTNHKANSQAGIMASDAAVLASIALQYGAPLQTLQRALMRDARGGASSPIGMALDMLDEDAAP